MLVYPALFLLGGAAYMMIELLWRRRTHWSMGVLGGLAFLLLFLVFSRIGAGRFIVKGAIGAVLITALEFLTGAVVNVKYGWNVWDYSALRFNLYGQVCLLYSALWFLLSIGIALIVQAAAPLVFSSGL